MTTKPHQTQSISDVMDPSRARALQATLGQTPSIVSGDVLPPFAHHIYFWDPVMPVAYGQDGPATTSDFIPDLGLPRRMWAAGRLVQHQPLRAGVKAEKTSVVEAVTRKDGRSGPFAFVRIRHDIKQRHALAVTEWQELVYSQANAPAVTVPDAPTVATQSEPLAFSSTQLFQYSALTFNNHRIHYDADFARDVADYAGLVVQTPLLAHLMMQLATRTHGTFQDFHYRSTSPLIAGEGATLCRHENHFWIKAADGRLCTSGHIM